LLGVLPCLGHDVHFGDAAARFGDDASDRDIGQTTDLAFDIGELEVFHALAPDWFRGLEVYGVVFLMLALIVVSRSLVILLIHLVLAFHVAEVSQGTNRSIRDFTRAAV